MDNQFENQWVMAHIRIQLIDLRNQSAKTIEADLPYFSRSRCFRVNQFLDDACRRGQRIMGSQLFHVDSVNKVNIFLGIYPLNKEIFIARESTMNECIQLTFKAEEKEGDLMEDVPQRMAEILEPKTHKVKERTIWEAMQAVKLWRNLYDTADESGKRLYTLVQAAKKVGIAKKTLDDYYIHIRGAIEHNFNLERFKERKVGLLRKFLRIVREQGLENAIDQMPECILDHDTDKYWVNFDDL